MKTEVVKGVDVLPQDRVGIITNYVFPSCTHECIFEQCFRLIPVVIPCYFLVCYWFVSALLISLQGNV